jgi:dUTPase
MDMPLLYSSLSVHEGDRVAQLILEKIYTPEVFEVEV